MVEIDNKPPLTPEEFHEFKKDMFLDVLQEECGEVVVAVSKIKRFGLHSYNPKDGTYNQANLIQEIGDILGTVELLKGIPELGLTDTALENAKFQKMAKVMYFVNNPVKKAN